MKLYKVFILSIAAELLTIPVRFWDRIADAWITPCIYVLIFYLLSKRTGPRVSVPLTGAIAFLFINVLASVLDGGVPWTVLPNLILSLLGIFIGWIMGTFSSQSVKGLCTLIFALFIGLYVFVGHKYWWRYLSDGTWTGTVAQELPNDWFFRLVDGQVITPDSLRNKIVVLDFWNTGCAACFAAFPVLDSSFKKYQSKVRFYAVNIPLDRDTQNQAFCIIKNRGYTFPVGRGNDIVASAFNVTAFPTSFLVYNGKLVFRGSLDDVIQQLPVYLTE